MNKEWQRLRDKQVWDENDVRDWDDVRRDADNNGYECHLGYIFDLCVQKNSELADGDPRKKYKGRVVFQGNRVVNQNHEAALFEDLGSAPATIEASRMADFIGCAQGNAIHIADAEQAYVQAKMRGKPTWVCLPPEQRPK